MVFLPYMLVFVCDTVGWCYAFERRPPVNFIRLLAIHVIGKAANIVTPLVPVGGEPIKAYLLQVGGIPFTEIKINSTGPMYELRSAQAPAKIITLRPAPGTESRSTRSHRKPRQGQGPPRWARRP
jgi:hypothetical protein